MTPTIIGRSSSHFTRSARIFAHELGVDYAFRPVFDLRSQEPADYAGNPALRIPILQTDDGAWFGALNLCRELSRRAGAPLQIVWPEDLRAQLTANAQELVLQGMSSEVTWLMGSQAAPAESGGYLAKSREALINILGWLEARLPQLLDALPAQRDLSFLEVTLFCFITHLGFRAVLDTAPFTNLEQFARRFAQRPAALATPYHFDQPAPNG
jgi:glutathione S-transferase